MDGNGRWAQNRGRPRVYGHVRGVSRVREIVREADRLGVRALTLFAFSTENWKRPQDELSVLWMLLKKFLQRELNELERKNVRLEIFGELHRLDPELQQLIQGAQQRLQHNTGLRLGFAISYGARREIVNAATQFARSCLTGNVKPEDLTEDTFQEFLWTHSLGGLSDVDLVIRTSGEQRVSNFLLWQSAYAEYVFPKVCWPDFRAKDFQEALSVYGERERRFGGVTSNASWATNEQSIKANV